MHKTPNKNSIPSGNELLKLRYPFLSNYIIPMTLKSVVIWVVYFLAMTTLLPWEFMYSLEWYQGVIKLVRGLIPKIGVVAEHSLHKEKTLVLMPLIYLEYFLGLLLCFFYSVPNYKILNKEISFGKAFMGIVVSLIMLMAFFYQLVGDTLPTGDTRRTRFAYLCHGQTQLISDYNLGARPYHYGLPIFISRNYKIFYYN